MPELDAIRTVDGWRFVPEDGLVSQLQVDYRFSLLLRGGVRIVIDQQFTLRFDIGSTLVPPGEDPSEVDAALPVFNKTVESLQASDTGELTITFSNGWRIDVPVEPSGYYENWEIHAPNGRYWIGLPGGGVEARGPT